MKLACIRPRIVLACLVVAAICCLPGKSRAQAAPVSGESSGQEKFDPWGPKDRLGRYGFALGFAKEIRLNKAQASGTELFSLRAQWVTRLYDFPKNRFLYRLELVHEGMFATSSRPSASEIYGFDEILRFDFDPVGRARKTMLYFDAGAGVNKFGLRLRELSGAFQFSLQAGIGFKYRPSRKRIAYGCEVAMDHFSDAGLTHPNQGVNLPRISCGVDILPR